MGAIPMGFVYVGGALPPIDFVKRGGKGLTGGGWYDIVILQYS